MQSWRFIPFMAGTGAFHMAVDEWLLEQHRQGLQPSILRFYTWEPIALSLGYHQRHWPNDWHQLMWQGEKLDLVRRPSGGRAVLHQGDLTYAVITSDLPANRMQAYQTICEFLLQGWQSLGVELHYGQAGRGYIQNPNCFGTATAADLVLADGSKLIGSAQLRRGKAILQHGSIRLQQDPDLFRLVFSSEPLLPQLPLLQQEYVVETVMAALLDAATQCFQMTLQVEPLHGSELQEIFARAAAFAQL